MTVYKIQSTVTTTSYLQLSNLKKIPNERRKILAGLLSVFQNQINLLTENMTDALTGLLNRKSFDNAITKIYDLIPIEKHSVNDDRRDESNSQYWLAMLDIDHFKSVNDRFGHVYGDDVLILLAKIIRSCFRHDDLFFRFGGEEFVLIIKCKDMDGARQALDRLLIRVSSYFFSHVGTVTISIGAVCIDKNIFAGTLLDYADQALYFSKNNGRNQLTFFESMIDQGIVEVKEIESGTVDLFTNTDETTEVYLKN